MKKQIFILIFFFAFGNSVFTQTFKVDTLLFNAPSEKRINYVILGDGYLESELPQFLEDAETITNALFDDSPFKEYKNFFNVYTISVPSNASGAADDPNNLIDNYFGSTFNYAGIQRLLVPTRNDRASSVLATNFPLYDQVIMVVNTDTYGGSGGWLATTSTHGSANEIAIHEIGHSFANLSDEYWAGAQYATESPNMTRESSRSSVKWKNWLDDFGIGIHAHDVDPSWKKPHENCKMEFLGVDFCAVCQEQFIATIYASTSPIDSYSPESSGSVEGTITFDVSLVNPDPNTMKITWYLDDDEITEDVESYDLDTDQLTSENHQLRAVVFDSTWMDRRNTLFFRTVTWNIGTSISSAVATTSEKRPTEEEVVTSISSDVSNFEMSIYPNPVNTETTLSYTLDKRANIELSIIDVNGRKVENIWAGEQQAGTHEKKLNTVGYLEGVYYVLLKTPSFERSFALIKR